MDSWDQMRYDAARKAVLPHCPEQVRSIVDVLLKHERNLSDGYEHYCGDSEGQSQALTAIAQEIMVLFPTREGA